MYEFEVEHTRLRPDELPRQVKGQFADPEADIRAISLIAWEEHCTECAMPECFRTCDLYKARKDGYCRRFIDGISMVPDVPTQLGYAVRVRFKRWGQLLGVCQKLGLVPTRSAMMLENVVQPLGTAVSRIPDGGIAIRGRHGMSSRLFKRIKHGLARSRLLTAEGMGPPDYFLIELFNPADVPVKLSFVARNLRGERRQFPYQRLLVLEPGFRRFKIPFDEIARQIDVQEEMHLIFNPNLRDVADEGRTLYFGLLGFVKDAKYRPPGAAAGKTVKVLVWDLDNTVWDGILVEDGPEKISLRPGVAEVIQELDRRGIMNSVASKNDPAFAMEQLERFGLAEYMVFPKIGWGPKSESIRQIVEDFDVGADTVAFIDDSPFERAEVMGSNPKVRVYRHDECGALLERSDFTTSKTAETGKRRQFYQNQALRRRARESFSGEYADFLRSCGIVLDITHARESNLDRVHELIQRTNQMNFSGSKYSRTEVERICGDADYETFCMTATDKFGDYGMIGACVVRKAGPRIVDLMFSCRIQAKRVEHAFLMLLLDYYRERGYERLEVVYRRTERNAQAGRVFEDLSFEAVESAADPLLYRFDLTRALPQGDVIEVRFDGAPWAAAARRAA